MHAPPRTGNIDPEYATTKGVTAIAGTEMGARATAGSSAMFNAEWGALITASYSDLYAPLAGEPVAVGNGRARSVAFTDVAPDSAALSGIGNGPAAYAAGAMAMVVMTNAVLLLAARGG